MLISEKEAAKNLLEHDNFLILSHASPDGDTLGSAFALYYALKKLNKKSVVRCSDSFPKQFHFLYDEYEDTEDFKPDYVVAVDVASVQLLGDKYASYKDKIDLCIDHHISNTQYADKLLLRADAAAACEIMFNVIENLNVDFDKKIATCIYTGISTDTGCFKFSNTTSSTHEIAAKTIDMGVDHATINRLLFDTKSKSRILIEQKVLNDMEFYYNDKVALIYVTKDMIKSTGAEESELEGVSAIPRMIEGVEVGITLREKGKNLYKASVRTSTYVDASKYCQSFGGGGHARAAGCAINGSLEQVKALMVDKIKDFL